MVHAASEWPERLGEISFVVEALLKGFFLATKGAKTFYGVNTSKRDKKPLQNFLSESQRFFLPIFLKSKPRKRDNKRGGSTNRDRERDLECLLQPTRVRNPLFPCFFSVFHPRERSTFFCPETLSRYTFASFSSSNTGKRGREKKKSVLSVLFLLLLKAAFWVLRARRARRSAYGKNVGIAECPFRHHYI